MSNENNLKCKWVKLSKQKAEIDRFDETKPRSKYVLSIEDKL
jgi:N-acyl-L-homoserine lactone synthetase